MQAMAALVPNFVGGSADLGPSNNTVLDGLGHVGPGAFNGTNLHFGIREHAMAAVMNGMALTGAFRPFCATFLVFSDYLKPTARLSSLMELPVTYVFSHDSFHVGEDGPTHQPIEHLWMLRSIPGMTVFRPADPVEVAAAWRFAARRDRGPVCIVTTRQAVRPFQRPPGCGINDVLRGGYVLREPAEGRFDAVVIATGSEVGNCMEAARQLSEQGIELRIVSMSSIEVFLAQDAGYRRKVLPDGIRRVTVEAGATFGWWRFLGDGDMAVGLDAFGASAPSKVLDDEFGFTPERLAERIRRWFNVKN
jgi:transketolase